jgi:hypothetical protein
MSHMRLFLAATIIALTVLITFALSVPHTRDVIEKPSPAVVEESIIPFVSISDTYKKGIHTISGSLETPTSCTVVSATASPSGNAPATEGIVVSISVLPDTGVCLQLPARTRFETTITAPANLPIIVTVNGSLATTTPS